MGAGRVWVVVLLVAALSAPLAAQEPPEGAVGETLNLFFDCQGFGCWDLDFFRREIPFVNWVRDREVSHVHVLVTTQTTGGGGRQYRLAFLGRGAFEGQGQELVVNTPGAATEDEVRRALVARLRLGLGRYLAGTPMADRLRVVTEGPPDGEAGPPGRMAPPAAAGPADDPWDFWVFNLRLSSNLSGESSYSQSSLNTSASANRVTDAWKLGLSGSSYTFTQKFELEDGTSKYTRKRWRVDGLLVKSVTDRFSVGTRAGFGRDSYVNEDFRWTLSPGVEFNVFPYSESSRRSLTLQALLNVRHWDYTATTIFGEDAETRLAGSLHAQLEFVQPWGRAEIGANHSRYVHDTSKWQSSLNAFIDVRLFKGFSVNMWGSYGWVRDQLYIDAEGYSQDEILLRQRALATDFNYWTSFGISYRFGSIFNNVVNPRFGGSEGGGMMIMF
ncbi:MAG: hypothetical protein AMXMBFR53_45200 [Gemmatimonadota bacterium]